MKDLWLEYNSEEDFDNFIEKRELAEMEYMKTSAHGKDDFSWAPVYINDAWYLEAFGILERNFIECGQDHDSNDKDVKIEDPLTHEEQLIVKEALESHMNKVGIQLNIDESKLKRYEYTFWA